MPFGRDLFSKEKEERGTSLVVPDYPKGVANSEEQEEEATMDLRLLVGEGLLVGPREEMASRRRDLEGITLRCMADDVMVYVLFFLFFSFFF